MSNATIAKHGLNPADFKIPSGGQRRRFDPAVIAKVLKVAEKVGITDLATDLGVHRSLIQQWKKQAVESEPKAKTKSSTSSKGPRKTAAKMNGHAEPLSDREQLLVLLRKEHNKHIDTAAAITATIQAVQNGGTIPETVNLMDAMVPVAGRKAAVAKGGRIMTAAGRKAIGDAARKRWAEYRRNNPKK